MTDVKIENNSLKKRSLRKVSQIGLALASVAFVVGSVEAVNAADSAKNLVAAEGGKKVLNQSLNVLRSKPALSIATVIVCYACAPIAEAAASTSFCIACSILIVKVLR